jgi:hypothetical protein
MEIRKAVRVKAKLRLGIGAPSGAGKTYTALLLAQGLGGKIGMIDTENGSGDLYADLLPGGYDIITLQAPYGPRRYVEAIRAFERAGYDTIIVDSLTHAWAGTGGSLDTKGKIEDRTGNGWAAWRTVTPEHESLVDAMLQSPCHIIATVRTKTEYASEKDGNGKTVVKKLGMAPVMKDGIEYEFTVFLEMDQEHVASTSKDRTGMFDGTYFKPAVETGEKLIAWLNAGIDAPPPPVIGMPEQLVADWLAAIDSATTLGDLAAHFQSACGDARKVHDVTAKDRFVTAKEIRKAALTQPQGAPA